MRLPLLLYLSSIVAAGCATRHQPRREPIAARDQPRVVMGAATEALAIEVLAFDGCPSMPLTMTNLEKAIYACGIAANVTQIDQMSLPVRDRRRHWPSPTILVNGRDLFGMAEPQNAAMRCRVYQNGAPSPAEIAKALRSVKR